MAGRDKKTYCCSQGEGPPCFYYQEQPEGFEDKQGAVFGDNKKDLIIKPTV